MLVTSLTTCAAFVATAFTPLQDVQSFGIFTAIVIWVDYMQVITWFPCAVVVYHNSCEQRPVCCNCKRCDEMICCDKRDPPPETSTEQAQQLDADAAAERLSTVEKFLQGPLRKVFWAENKEYE